MPMRPASVGTVTTPVTPPAGEQVTKRVKGPVTLRREQIEHTTTDQRLLDERGPSDWVHTDPWRVLRIQAEFVEGFGALAKLGRSVCVFGSARTPETDPEYAQARELGAALAQEGYTVITGGGPGIMEAANRGAYDVGGLSVGLGIELPHEQGLNQYLDIGVDFRYFFARKTMFVKYAQAFVVFPGGFGSLDELFESLTLVQTGKITWFPVILVGVDYWSGLVEWLKERVVVDGKISPDDFNLIHLTDDVSEIVRIIGDSHRARDEGQDWHDWYPPRKP